MISTRGCALGPLPEQRNSHRNPGRIPRFSLSLRLLTGQGQNAGHNRRKVPIRWPVQARRAPPRLELESWQTAMITSKPSHRGSLPLHRTGKRSRWCGRRRSFGALPKTAEHVPGHEEVGGHDDGVAHQPEPQGVGPSAPPKHEAGTGASVNRVQQEYPRPVEGCDPALPPGPGEVGGGVQQ